MESETDITPMAGYTYHVRSLDSTTAAGSRYSTKRFLVGKQVRIKTGNES